LFVAIVLHKAPEGFTIASIMLAAGRSRRAAQLSAIVVGAASVVGALSVYPLRRFVGEGLALSAGVTLYVAASDLIPEVNRSDARGMAIVVFAGVLLYYVTERMLAALGM
jgi:ZIP family zinc transporter/zinc and cadmium transporter